MDAIAAPPTCGNRECKFALDGTCLEGFAPPSDCPHFGKQPVAEEREGLDASGPASGRALPSGSALNVAQAEAALRYFRSRVVAFVGAADSGKTSLFASLYDCFQEGKMQLQAFARSSTLVGLEEVCYHARSASGRDTPHSPRTKRGPVRFYHLELQDVEGSNTTLLLSDRAGEHYLDARSDSGVVGEFVEIARADCVCVLVDGERLLDPAARHQVRTEILVTFRAFQEGGLFRGEQRLSVVLTKVDLLDGHEERERAEDQFSSLVDAIRSMFGSNFSDISSHRVCAQPIHKPEFRARGVADLVASWMIGAQSPLSEIKSAMGTRQFARLRPLGSTS